MSALQEGLVYILRKPCQYCGSTSGEIRPKGGQDVVYCECGKYAGYNAPRVETGRAVRSLSSRQGLTPGQRHRILEAHDFSCISCGRRPPDVELQIDHLISRHDAEAAGCLDELIDSEDNLAPQCAECNSGKGRSTVSIRMMHRVLQVRDAQKRAGR